MNGGPFMVDLWPHYQPHLRESDLFFEDITLYQLCYWKVTRIYGLTQEEIKTLSTNPERSNFIFCSFISKSLSTVGQGRWMHSGNLPKKPFCSTPIVMVLM